MKILRHTDEVQEILFIPRKQTDTVDLVIRGEFNQGDITYPNLKTTIKEGYTSVYLIIDLDENKYYSLDVLFENELIYQDRIFCTNQDLNIYTNNVGNRVTYKSFTDQPIMQNNFQVLQSQFANTVLSNGGILEICNDGTGENTDMNDLSIWFRPEGYNTGILYNYLPYDPDNERNIHFDFSRSGDSSTRVNKNGLIEIVDVNIPRIDSSKPGCANLLLEPSRENTYLYSEPTVDNGEGANILLESFEWDNGFTNCVKFNDNSITRSWLGGVASSGVDNVLSFYIIMDDLSKPEVGSTINTGDFSIIISNLLVSDIPVYEHILNTNIWRVSVVSTAGVVDLGINGIQKYTSQSSKGFRVVGWQITQGEYITSYIHTNGSSEIRGVESAINAGDTLSINSVEGVLYLNYAALVNEDINKQISLSDGTLDNRININFRSNVVIASIKVLGVTQASFAYSMDVTFFNKVAVRYKKNNFSIWVNGNKVGSDLTIDVFTVNTLDRLSFDVANGTDILEGLISECRVYNKYLSDNVMQNL